MSPKGDYAQKMTCSLLGSKRGLKGGSSRRIRINSQKLRMPCTCKVARVQVDVDVDILRSYCILKDRIGGLADRLEKISSNSIKDDLQSVVDTLEVVTAEPASPDWANHEYIAIVSDLVASSTEDIVAGIENSELMPDEAQPIIDDARNIRERAEQLRKASEKNYSV